jgi:hypothetical protein
VDATEAQEGIEDAVKDARTRKLALLIATLAALLAVVGMQDDNSAQDAVQSNIQASDLWAFFQAKSLRQFTLERQSEVLKIPRWRGISLCWTWPFRPDPAAAVTVHRKLGLTGR